MTHTPKPPPSVDLESPNAVQKTKKSRKLSDPNKPKRRKKSVVTSAVTIDLTNGPEGSIDEKSNEMTIASKLFNTPLKVDDMLSLVRSSEIGVWSTNYFTEISKNVKSKGLQVLDTVTTAAAVYAGGNTRLRDKKKKREMNSQNSCDATNAALGIGTVYVHLISAFKVRRANQTLT